MKNFLRCLFLVPIVLSFISCETKKKENASEMPMDNIDAEKEDNPAINFEKMDPIAFPDAMIEMYSPLGNQTFTDGKVPFEFNVKNFPFTEEPRGFLLRMVINGNDPISYHLPIFKREFNAGSYRAVAYLIDQKGIALKEFGNFVDRDFQVGGSKPFPDSNEPYMVVNLPESNHIYQAEEEVILDVLLIGGALKEDKLKFIISVNGQEEEMKELVPIKLNNLSPGVYEIQIKLVKENGVALEGIFTSAKRIITVKP